MVRHDEPNKGDGPMNTYHVVCAGSARWGIERTRDHRAPDLLPITFCSVSVAAWVVFEMTREDLRYEQAERAKALARQ
jgi:hypothetical protein